MFHKENGDCLPKFSFLLVQVEYKTFTRNDHELTDTPEKLHT